MATINVMANKMGADVIVVDIGIRRKMDNEHILPRKIRMGTANMAKGPAMTRQEAIQGIETGIELAILMKEKGYRMIATGEMGIGNTTTSSAVLSVLLGEQPEDMTGKGAGLSSEGIKNKSAIIRKSIELNQPDPSDPLDVLCKVGGLDIAGICGLYIGGGVAGIPVLIDGFISSVAALLALKICPSVGSFIFATHLSNEPASKKALNAIGLTHLIDCNMCLGEGTGAVAAFGIFDLAEEVYRKMSSFEDIHLEPYQPFA
jgi:nicotinate-nucleotide--dimethylbenzimidazole phosphoribosyltransferase